MLKLKRYSIIVALLMATSCSHQKRLPDFTLPEQLEALRSQHHVPGASIAVLKRGDVSQVIPLGKANLEKDVPIGENTLFQACSMTKTLTSALVLKEFDSRRLSIDQPANQFLKRWKIPAHQSGTEVTVRMLLNHTAGISNPYPDGGSKPSSIKATLVEHFLGLPPAFNPPLRVEEKPGNKYRYCNGCYSILQMVIEDLTGKGYRDLVTSQILNPIGMKTSTFDDTLLDSYHENVAINYDDSHKVYPPQRKLPIYATGSLWTTPKELALYIAEIQKGLQGKSKILTVQVARQLIKPSSTETRGLGFFIGDRYGDDQPKGGYFFHGGQNVGYLAMMIGSINGDSGAVVMINISSPWSSKEFPHFKFVKEAIRLIGDFYEWK